MSKEMRERERESVCVCARARVSVHMCSVFVSFSLLGSYAKFVPDFIFVFFCVFKES